MRTLVRALVATLVLGAGAFAATESGASPQVSITAGTNPVTEGASAAFTLTRTGSTADALNVNLNVAETGAMLAGTPSGGVTFAIGSTTAGLVLATGDDEVAEAASVVTAVLASGNGYTVDANAASATVTVEDDDAAPVVTSNLPEEVPENRVAIGTLTATDADTDVADLVWSVVGGLDAARVTLSVDGFLAFRTPKDFETPEDDDGGGDYEIVVQVTDGANPVDVEFKVEITDVNDEAPVVATASPVLVPENRVAITTLTATDADTPAADLVWSVTGGADAAAVTLSADGVLVFGSAKDFEAPDDANHDGDYEVAVRVTDGANPVDAALVVRLVDLDGIPPTLSEANVDGSVLKLTFSEALDESSVPATGAFAVTVDGTARGVSGVVVRASKVTLTLVSAVAAGDTVTVGYTASPGANASPLRGLTDNMVISFSNQAVTNETLEPINIAPTGLPTIAGIARVGETLTASATGIADADGLVGAMFAWQWIAKDGTSYANIAGATNATYTLTTAEAGKKIKVRVTFTDDRGAEETLVSEAKRPVNTAPTGLPAIAGTARVGETLTASTTGIADADGLVGAVFAWQWIANDRTSDADIAGATSATYILTTAEAGKTIKVRVTFTDDGGTEETLVSDATAAVEGILTVVTGFNLTYENVTVERDKYLAARLDWTAPETDPDATAWRLEWQKVGLGESSWPQRYDPSRSYTLPVASGTTVTAGDSFSVKLLSTSTDYDFTANVIGSASNDSHVFRVVALRGSDEHVASEELRAQYDPRHYLRTYVRSEVARHRANHPWIGEALDHLEFNNIPIRYTPEFDVGGVGVLCHSHDSCTELTITRVIFPDVEPTDQMLVHELAHVYSFMTSQPNKGPVAIAQLYTYDISRAAQQAGSVCDNGFELFADVATLVTLGENNIDQQYWPQCRSPKKDTVEAMQVFRSVLAGSMPAWFHDSFGTGSEAGLEGLWELIKTLGWGGIAETSMLRDEFGGFCRPGFAQEYSDFYFEIGNGTNWKSISNPWRDGGCVPGAPAALTVSGSGDGPVLRVSWTTPKNVGSSPVSGYQVQWRTAEQAYSDVAADGRSASVQGTSLEIPFAADAPIAGVRVRTLNDEGESEWEEVAVTRETGPAISTATVDGSLLRLDFGVVLDETSTPATDAFAVTVGSAARGVDSVEVSGNAAVLTLSTAVAVGETTVTAGYTVPTGANASPIRDLLGRSAVGFSNWPVTNNTPNSPPSGLPTISGFPIVGETLTASAAGISDPDGLTDATFAWQWIATDRREHKDIAGATGPTYTVTAAETGPTIFHIGKTIMVRVTFTDDGGTEETLVSKPTGEVEAWLTANFSNVPQSHDGSAEFTMELHFSEEIRWLSNKALTVRGGSVREFSRLQEDDYSSWQFTVRPARRGDISLALEVMPCEEHEAVCTPDNRELAEGISVTVPGPASAPKVSIAAGTSPVTEGTPAVFTLSRTGSLAGELVVDVSVAETGAMLAGTPAAAATFAVDAQTVELTVATEDDEVAESASAVTAALVAGSGYTVDANAASATVTVEDDDGGPANTAPGGLPTIAGTAQVGETLTASAAGITDADGLTGVVYAWQWIANDGASDADIAGATAPTYVPTAAEVGKTVKVRVTFTDNGGTEETLVSDPTAVVAVGDDEAPVVTTASPVLAPENGLAVATLTATDADTPATDLVWSIEGGADAAAFTLSADGVLVFGSAKDFEAPDDADNDGDYEVTVRVTDGANPVDAALVVRLVDVDEIAPTLTDASVDGAALALAFSEALDGSGTPDSGAFTVTVDGTARGVSGVAVSASTVTLTLVSAVVAGETVTVGYTVPAGANASRLRDDAGNPVAGFTGEAVRNDTAAPLNTAPTGLPTIAGTAQVGETLTASATGIADADGLTNAVFAWQWIANDGTADADIAGATSATYTLTTAEAGQTIRVRVTFTDNGGTEETLVSDPTAAVVAAAVLTASFGNVPGSHDGSTVFTLELYFSEEVPISDRPARTLRDESLEVSGATVTKARRLAQGSNLGWTITVEPATDGDITIALPVRTCGATGAVCTADGRALAQDISGTVPGPASEISRVSIAAVTSSVIEGTSATFTLTRTGSSADALNVNLNVAETGAMLAGTPSGGVTFAIGSTTAGLVLATGDDEVAEAASVVTAVLASGNGYTVDASAASATVTVEDDDAAPVVTSNLPEEVPENRVAIGTLTATDADTDVADLVWSVVGGLDAARVTLSVDGFLAFRTPKDFETPEDDDGGGDYEIVVQVTDGANPVDVEFKVQVTDVNDEEPVVVTASPVLVPEIRRLITTLEAEDADSPATDLVWSIAGGVDGDKVTLSADGILAFRGATDFEAPLDSDRDGDYEVTVHVTDGVNAVDVPLTVRLTDVIEFSPLAGFGLQYLNVVDDGNGSLIARLRWTAPETDPNITAWRLDWQKIGLGELSQPWAFDESSSYTSTIPAGTTVSAGDSFSVDLRPSSSKYEFSVNVAGSNLNDMHVFRVVALRGSHEHAVSPEVGGQIDPQQYLRDRIVSVVEEHEVRSPWIRETLDYLDANGIPIIYGQYSNPGVYIWCIGSTDCTELRIGGMVFPRLDATKGTIAHELGHVYATAPELSNRAPIAIAYAYLANVYFEGEGGCPFTPELIADLITSETVATAELSYWDRCESPAKNSSEASRVMASALAGAIPDWLQDANGTVGDAGLENLWELLDRDRDLNSNAAIPYVKFLESEFGGYCRPNFPREFNQLYNEGIDRDSWRISNPWRSGGCIPGAPQELDASVDGTALTVRWSAPRNAGSSLITGYRIQWRAGDQSYSDAVANGNSTSVQGAPRSVEIPFDPDAPVASFRIRAVNDEGEGAWAERTATSETGPAVLSARVNGTSLTLEFDVALDEASTPGADAFAVAVDGSARAVDAVGVLGSVVNLTLSPMVEIGQAVSVAYTVPTGANANPIKDVLGTPARSFTRRTAANETPNMPPTGLPTISGIARTAMTLTASAAGISDPNGLTGATFAWQWIVRSALSTTYEDIEGATSHIYKLTYSERGRRVKVRTTFTDDRGKVETLVSAATAVVETSPLTARFENVPETHDGSSTFTFELRTSEPIRWLWKRALKVNGGLVQSLSNLDESSYDRWRIVIGPETDADISIVLPAPVRPCSVQDESVCTPDRRPLSKAVSVVVPGPASATTEVSIAAGPGPVAEGTDAVFTLTRTGDLATALTVPVSVTESGAMLAGTPPASATFDIDSSTAELAVATENDAVAEASSVITAALVDGNGYVPASGADSATVTAENDDAGPANTAPTGLPAIAGTAMVGETLSASASGIADADGLANSVFAWQWIANDGTADAYIAGATGPRYELAGTEVGKTVKARVTFTDDGGTQETLVSDPTSMVAWAPLTAHFLSVPGSHDGSTEFTFELHFSEEISLGTAAIQNDALETSGGEVMSATRLWRGSRTGWWITVVPDGDGDIAVALRSRGCGETGAVCTPDGRVLAQGITATVPGPVPATTEVSISAGTSPVTEGTAAEFTLTRTGDAADALTVNVMVSETGAMLAGTPPASVAFGVGATTAELAVATENDERVEASSVVTAGLVGGSVYAVDANGASATVTAEDDDDAPVVTTAATLEVPDDTVAIGTLTATDGDTSAANLVWSVAGGADLAMFALSGNGVLEFHTLKDYDAPDDADRDGDYEITVRVTDGANPVDAALVVRLVDVGEIAPTLSDASVDGAALALAFSEALDASGAPAPGAFTVTVDGTARGVSGVAVSASTVTLTLVSAVVAGETVTVGYTVPAGANASPLRDDAGNPVAGFTGEAVRNDTAAPLNTAPTGLPTIAGTAQVGETLTASATGIADADGLAGAVFAWQWIANDGTADADIAGATGPTYILTAAEAGKTVKVRVTFTDDGGTEETLVGDPTAAVVAALVASFVSVPAEHDGVTEFWLELSFDAAVVQGSKEHIRALLGVTGGSVTRVRRKDGRLDHWRVRVEPSSHDVVTVSLAASPACGQTGAVCTADGRRLVSPVGATVPGPASGISRVSIAAVTSPVIEGTSATFTLTRTGSSADALTVGVGVTETGAMLAGAPATGVTFGAGSTAAALAVLTEDDEAVETASVVSAALVAGSGYTLDANAATAAVTVDDDDEAPVVTAAAQVDALENGVAVATLTATDADTPPAELVWSIEGGADAAAFTLSADGVLVFGSAKDFEAPDDADNDGDYEVTVRVTDGANPVDAALVVRLVDVDEIAPTLTDASVDGAALALVFSEALDASGTPDSGAFTVTVDGTARGVSGVAVSASTVTLTLVSAVAAGETVTVGYTVPAGANASRLRDDAGNPVAGFTGEAVRNDTAAPLNTAPTGLPTIAGTAQVGETLTASATGIADADGLTNAVFAWQWIANDGTADADIAGATSATYTLTTAEAGQTIRVRVTFTDDGGTEETLVGDPTAAVVAALVANFVSVPAEHDGVTEFWLELSFDAAVVQGSKEHIRALLGVSGGSVTRVRRKDGRLDHWRVRVEPSSHDVVTVSLAASPACGQTGAVCTADGRRLVSPVGATVPGPASGISRVSIAAVTSPVIEGTSATFTLTRTGSSADALTVGVGVTETGAMLAGAPATGVTFGAGSTAAALAVLTEDDEAVETASVVSAALVAGSGYTLDANAATAAVTVDDDDEAPVVTAAAQVDALENGVAVATLTATDADTPPAELVWSIEGGADAAAFTLSADGVLVFGSAKDFEAPDDADNDGDYEVTVRVTDGANPVDAALVVRLVDVDEIAPTLTDASVDGAALALVFSEALDASGTPDSGAFTVTVDGTARGVSGVAVSASTVTLTLVSAVAAGETVTVGYTVPAGANASRLRDDAGNPVAGFTGEAVRNDTAAPLNTAPTGLPTIAGTAQVGETLTASATGIADADGLTNAVFAWQWIANDGTADADITGATSATYTLTTAEAGQTIRVRVTFTDNGGTEETLVGDPTAAVVAALVASFVSVPVEHDGVTEFWLELSFDAAVVQGSKEHIRALLGVSGGSVTRVRRKDDRLDHWRVRVEPSSHEAVTVSLAASPACGQTGAVCTADGRRLASPVDATVPGPALQVPEVSIAAVTSPVIEGTSATFTLTRTGSSADALTVGVGVTETGAMLAGVPATGVTFGAGSATAALAVVTEDDEAVEAASVVSAALVAGSGYTLDVNAATAAVTVDDDDEAPVVTAAAQVDALENGVAVATLTATDADTPPAELVWSIEGGADAAAFTLGADGVLVFGSAKDFEAPDDADNDGDYEVTVRVTDGANPVDAALVVRLVDVDEIAPTLSDASVDGAALALVFSEALDASGAPAPGAFAVTVDGTARGVSGVAVSASTVTLTLVSAVAAGETVTVGYTVPAGANASRLRDDAGNPVAGFTGEAVGNDTAAPLNTAPTGLPTIAGTAQVGETLTASATGIADADGLTNAVFAWQWIANDGTADADIAGATGPTYILTAAEAGKTVKVRVTFTDDGGTEETLVSAAKTVAVVALPVVSIAAASSPVTEGSAAEFTLRRTGPASLPLTVSVSVRQAGAVLSGTLDSTVMFASGSAESRLRVATVDDGVNEADGRVTASVVAGSGYGVEANASTATVDVYDNDEATTTPTETLWTSTLTVQSIGGALLGTVGGGNALSPDGWSEDGESFEVEQLYYFPQYSELAFTVSVAPSETGQLTLHLDDLQVQLRGSPGVRYFYWVVDHPGWQAGQAVAVRLTRSGRDTAVAAGVSVADAQVQEAEGAVLSFRVTLDAAQSETVSVRYATSGGTATAGADFVGQSGALRFAPGETSKTVGVSVLNDAHDEGSETMTLTLSRPFGAELADATATGTIVNTGPLPGAWLARFGRTVAEHVIGAVDDRLTAPHDTGSQVTIAGHRVDLDGGGQSWDGAWEQGRRDGAPLHPGRDRAGSSDPLLGDRFFSDGLASGASRELSARELLSGTAFRFASPGGDDDGAGQWTMWGRGAWSGFDGRDEALSLDGDVTTGMVGTDYRRDGWLAGLVFSHSEGSGTYALDGVTEDRTMGELDTSLTGLYPYLGIELSERLSAWGVAGYGRGTLTLRDEDAAALETDIDFTMAAGGMRGEVLGGGERGGFGLAVESDALIARTGSEGIAGLLGTAATVSRLRVGLEGSYELALDGGGTLAPTLEMGLRHDGGDAETGFGVELGGGLRYADPVRGISTDFNVRGLVAHEDSGYGEWGASGSLRYDPTGASDLGPSLTLTQHWGVSSSGGMESLFARQTMSGIAPEDDRYAPGARLDADVGYGFSVPGGRSVAIPYAGVSRSAQGQALRLGGRLRSGTATQWHLAGEFPEGEHTFRIGYRYRLGPLLGLGVEGIRRDGAAGESPEHGIRLRGILRW